LFIGSATQHRVWASVVHFNLCLSSHNCYYFGLSRWAYKQSWVYCMYMHATKRPSTLFNLFQKNSAAHADGVAAWNLTSW